LSVNVTGCLVIGIVGVLLHTGMPEHEHEPMRLLVMVGLLGGFTTFSSFGYDTLKLIDAGHVGMALLNVAANNAAGLAAVWIGYRLTQRWVGGQ